MATASFSVPGVRFTASLAEQLAETLRPYVMAVLQARLGSVEGLGPGESDGYPTFPDHAQQLRDDIAGGAKVTIEVKSIVDREGVRHEPSWRRDDAGEILKMLDDGDAESAVLSVSAAAEMENFVVEVHWGAAHCNVSVSAPSAEIRALKGDIEALLRTAVDPDLLRAMAPPFKVFIGHGANAQWKYLRRALEAHDFIVEAFESIERAGYHTLVVVEQMVRSSTVGVVVMTGDDAADDGSLRARENVVHEVGFCQGALGIDRTIILMEEGISEPSNIAGLTQIRFKRGALIDAEEKILDALAQRRSAHEFQWASAPGA